MSATERSNDEAKKLGYENSKNSKINGVSIHDGGKLSKVIQDVWLKNALTGSLSSIKKGMHDSITSNRNEDERSLKNDDQMSNSDSFTSNFDEVFDSPNANEIPEDYRVSHPYNLPANSNPYIQRFNVNTPGKNPFMSRSSYMENAEVIMGVTVMPSIDTPENISKRVPQLLDENDMPITPLRANKPRNGFNQHRTPSIKLHTPEPNSNIVSLGHSRPLAMQHQQQEHPENNSPQQLDSPMPMPRTNPNCARVTSKSGGSSHHVQTPFRYPGDGEQSPSTSPEKSKPLHSAMHRTDSETGSLYQMENGAQQNDENGPSEGTEASGASFDKSFNLVDASPTSSEPMVDLGNTPVDLGALFSASNTPNHALDQDAALLSAQPREVTFDVTPAPTVCSSYQSQLGSGLSAAATPASISRDSISSCETHRLDLYQPPNAEEEKRYNRNLKIAVVLMIFGSCMFLAAIIALIVEDPLDIV